MTTAAAARYFSNPQFLCSIADNKPPRQYCYVVFAGRSNAGKSSVINTLCGGRYARVAKTPGRTRLINLFRLGVAGNTSNAGNTTSTANPASTSAPSAAAIADLPGYGYAAVSKTEQAQWAPRMARFLQTASLGCLVVIIDCRRGLGALDRRLLALTEARAAPTLLLLNKADKLTRRAQIAAVADVAAAAAAQNKTFPTILFSAAKKIGADETRQWILNALR